MRPPDPLCGVGGCTRRPDHDGGHYVDPGDPWWTAPFLLPIYFFAAMMAISVFLHGLGLY